MALELSEIRQQITQIDRSLLKLLSERHRLAFDVVRSKEVTQKALRDVEREQALLQELIQFAENENYQLEAQYITSIFQKITRHCYLFSFDILHKVYNSKKIKSDFLLFFLKR